MHHGLQPVSLEEHGAGSAPSRRRFRPDRTMWWIGGGILALTAIFLLFSLL
jgi:hypothetical protein